jgi:hypothetical protein
MKAIGVSIKGAFSLAWALLCVSLFMTASVSDHYPGGYETMLQHASVLFAVGALIAVVGLIAGAVWRRKVSVTWLAVGGLQVFASLVAIVVLLMKASQ